MKSSIKILLIALAATMVVAFGIAGIILVVTGDFNVATENINESKTFEPSEISSIEVDLVSDDLNIIPTTKGDITVHFYGEVSTNVKRNLPELVAYKTGDKLYIEVTQTRNIFVGVNIRRTTLDIYIPKIVLEGLDIDLVSGDVILNEMEIAELKIDTTSGDIKVEELLSEKIRIDSTSGDVLVKDYTGDVEVSNTSGNVSLVSGSNNEDIFVTSTSGDIFIEQDAVSGISIGVVSGDVRIKLPEDAAFYLNASTTSGEIKQDFPMDISSSSRRHLEGKVNGGEERIVIDTTSGDITIDIDY